MHAGDVSPTDAYERLARDPNAVLVDVRTRAEWMYVGTPDLAAIGKRVVLLEWQAPDGTVHAGFVDALKDGGVPEDAPVFFICRSGARSASAAAAATAAGYSAAHNVAHGFEGPPDMARHRGAVAGWKADGLPWQQT
jgi:rhodanese-related sulfurtransferase